MRCSFSTKLVLVLVKKCVNCGMHVQSCCFCSLKLMFFFFFLAFFLPFLSFKLPNSRVGDAHDPKSLSSRTPLPHFVACHPHENANFTGFSWFIFRLALQFWIYWRHDDQRADAFPRSRHSDTDVWATAYDQLCLHSELEETRLHPRYVFPFLNAQNFNAPYCINHVRFALIRNLDGAYFHQVIVKGI